MSVTQAFLRVVSGPRQGLSIPLLPDKPVLIGRSRGELLLDDPLVSGSHCRISLRGGRYLLQDLNSTNGTIVDGRRVVDAALRPGSEVAIGSTRLVLFVSEEEGSVSRSDEVLRSDIAWLMDDERVAVEPSASRLGAALRLPPRMEGSVEVMSGPDVGRVFRFARGSVLVGRRQADVALSDPEVSRRHASVELFGPDMAFLRDVASTNGTFVNGRRVSMARIHPGDRITCGKSELRFYSS